MPKAPLGTLGTGFSNRDLDDYETVTELLAAAHPKTGVSTALVQTRGRPAPTIKHARRLPGGYWFVLLMVTDRTSVLCGPVWHTVHCSFPV